MDIEQCWKSREYAINAKSTDKNIQQKKNPARGGEREVS